MVVNLFVGEQCLVGDAHTRVACLAHDIDVGDHMHIRYRHGRSSSLRSCLVHLLDDLGGDASADRGDSLRGQGEQGLARASKVYDHIRHHLAAEGDQVIAAVAIPDRITGHPVDLIDVATVRNGKIVEFKIHFYDAQSMATASRVGDPAR